MMIDITLLVNVLLVGFALVGGGVLGYGTAQAIFIITRWCFWRPFKRKLTKIMQNEIVIHSNEEREKNA